MLPEQWQRVVRGYTAQSGSPHRPLYLLDRKIKESGSFDFLITEGADLFQRAGIVRGQQSAHRVELQANGEPEWRGLADAAHHECGSRGACADKGASGYRQCVPPATGLILLLLHEPAMGHHDRLP